MMQQKQIDEAIYQQADQGYARYEGNQTGGPRLRYETSSEQGAREEQFNKVYPLQSDKATTLCFALAVIALGLIVFFGLLFVVLVGGSVGGGAFVAACFATLI